MALKILLADDSMTAQNMGKKILVDAGYEVVAVSNGAAAIKKMAAERPDIAILDVYMPGYTGLEVCERVKASGETAKTPVLLTVGKMEAFNAEDVNRVKADGVMIKPFEASDLIAAVQSIAQRLLAPAPPPRGVHDSTVQLRAGIGSLEDTLRVPPPKPKAEPNPEDTLRLTAQEIRAFQDASYHDWAKTAEPHLEDHEKAAAEAEMPVTPEVEEEPQHAEMPMAAVEDEAPAMHAAAMDVDTPTVRETPVFSAMSASGVAAEHEIFTAATTPIASVEEMAEESSAAPVFYTPPAIDTVAEEASPAFAVQSASPVMEPEPIAPLVEAEVAPVAPILEPVVEPTPIAELAPVLETSSPLTPGPMPVEQAAELEPTIAAAVEVASAQAHELEITSPPPERGGSIAQDAGLITDSDDMSEFVTKFGVEGAETVHVGVVSDLSDEQLAAIMTPVSEDAPATPFQSIMAEPPVVSEVVTPEVVEETPAIEVAPDVVSIEAVERVEEVPPVVVDSEPQRITVVTEPEPEMVAPIAEPTPVAEETREPVVQAVDLRVADTVPEEVMDSVSATVLDPTPTVLEPPPTVLEATPTMMDAAPSAVEDAVPVPVELGAPVSEEPAPVDAIAEPPQVEEPTHAEEVSEVAHAGASALAVAAGAAAAAGLAHVIHAEPSHLEESSAHSAAKEATHPQHEPFGDAALAEELAAALSSKESEERARATIDSAATAALDSTSVSDAVHASGMDSQGLSDHKLADAVARAFENLKPQIITEIIKELAK